jgi:hypothetical protein
MGMVGPCWTASSSSGLQKPWGQELLLRPEAWLQGQSWGSGTASEGGGLSHLEVGKGIIQSLHVNRSSGRYLITVYIFPKSLSS